MSSLASFYRLDRQFLPLLVQAAENPDDKPTVSDALGKHARELDDLYLWSGYCLINVLSYLEEAGIALDHSEYDAESDALNAADPVIYLITPAHQEYLSRLDPEHHDEQALTEYFEANGDGFEESGMAALDALTVPHEEIGALADPDILIIHIG